MANKIARQLWAMSAKKKDANLVEGMHNERYQRTFTDEYYPQHKPRGRFEPVPPEQKKAWLALHNKGKHFWDE